MFCLKCGKTTGDDEEYCIDCATDTVESRVIEDEHVLKPGDMNITRCRTCQGEINSADDECPHCGAASPAEINKLP